MTWKPYNFVQVISIWEEYLIYNYVQKKYSLRNYKRNVSVNAIP